MDDQPKTNSLDILGIRPVAEAVNKSTSALIDGAAAVLSRICLPAAEELGLGLKDRVSHWRAQQLALLSERVAVKLSSQQVPAEHHAHPRLVHTVIENGSWNDGDTIQDMWAGILVSGCSEDGAEDSNIMFAKILEPFTNLQAKLFNAVCERCRMRLDETTELVTADYQYPDCPRGLEMSFEQLCEITGVSDLYRLDRELDHLRAIGILDTASGFRLGSKLVAGVSPSPLGIQLYVRCQGFRGSPVKFFKLEAQKATASTNTPPSAS